MREDRVNAILHTLIHLKQKEDKKADMSQKQVDTVLFAFLSKIRDAGLAARRDGTNLVKITFNFGTKTDDQKSLQM